MLQYERKLLLEGFNFICGIDEAGRGPLAGPVVVAAVIMPLDNIIEGIDDSKKLSEKKRNELYLKIKDVAVDIKIAVVDNVEIDKINILNATKKGMLECLDAFEKLDFALIDAVKLDTKIPNLPIIHGDSLSYSIAAASIVAKVTRDSIMTKADKEFPQYKFAQHKGYPTALHIELLKQHGACPIHRNTFLKNFALKNT